MGQEAVLVLDKSAPFDLAEEPTLRILSPRDLLTAPLPNPRQSTQRPAKHNNNIAPCSGTFFLRRLRHSTQLHTQRVIKLANSFGVHGGGWPHVCMCTCVFVCIRADTYAYILCTYKCLGVRPLSPPLCLLSGRDAGAGTWTRFTGHLRTSPHIHHDVTRNGHCGVRRNLAKYLEMLVTSSKVIAKP